MGGQLQTTLGGAGSTTVSLQGAGHGEAEVAGPAAYGLYLNIDGRGYSRSKQTCFYRPVSRYL